MSRYLVIKTGIVNEEFWTDLDLKTLYKQATSYGRLAYKLNAKVTYHLLDAKTYADIFSMYTRKSKDNDRCRLVRFNACAKYGDLNLKDEREF